MPEKEREEIAAIVVDVVAELRALQANAASFSVLYAEQVRTSSVVLGRRSATPRHGGFGATQLRACGTRSWDAAHENPRELATRSSRKAGATCSPPRQRPMVRSQSMPQLCPPPVPCAGRRGRISVCFRSQVALVAIPHRSSLQLLWHVLKGHAACTLHHLIALVCM